MKTENFTPKYGRRIRFEFQDEFGDTHIMETMESEDGVYNHTLQKFGEMLNVFMRQIGFYGFDKDMILMESITAEEEDLLIDYLHELRSKGEEEC